MPKHYDVYSDIMKFLYEHVMYYLYDIDPEFYPPVEFIQIIYKN